MILRSFYRAISNSFHDLNDKKKGVDVYPIINQNGVAVDESHKEKHKGMSSLECLIAGVFGANVGGIKRDESAKIPLPVWKALCVGIEKARRGSRSAVTSLPHRVTMWPGV